METSMDNMDLPKNGKHERCKKTPQRDILIFFMLFFGAVSPPFFSCFFVVIFDGVCISFVYTFCLYFIIYINIVNIDIDQ